VLSGVELSALAADALTPQQAQNTTNSRPTVPHCLGTRVDATQEESLQPIAPKPITRAETYHGDNAIAHGIGRLRAATRF
jgi:hypothetical protein